MLMRIPSLAARIAVSVAAAAFLSADGLRAQAGPHLSGRVIDSDTGQPIVRAIVQLSGRRALTIETDAEGRYQSGPLLPGMYGVTVSRDGYQTAMPLYAGRVPLRLRVREDGAAPI